MSKGKAHGSYKAGKVFGRAARYRGAVASWEETRAIQNGMRDHAPAPVAERGGHAPMTMPAVSPHVVAKRMAAGESLTQIAVAVDAPLAAVRTAWMAACRGGTP